MPPGSAAKQSHYSHHDIASAVKEGLLRGQIPPEVLGPQIYGCYRLARQDWAHGYFDLDGFRKQALIGVFLCLASDAEPAFRERLIGKVTSLS